MIIKLLSNHLSLKGGYRGSSESTFVKMSNCWKSHAAAHIHLCRPYTNLFTADVGIRLVFTFFYVLDL